MAQAEFMSASSSYVAWNVEVMVPSWRLVDKTSIGFVVLSENSNRQWQPAPLLLAQNALPAIERTLEAFSFLAPIARAHRMMEKTRSCCRRGRQMLAKLVLFAYASSLL